MNNIPWDEIPDFSSDYDTYKNPVEGRTYISPSMEDKFSGSPDSARTIRLVTRGIDQEPSYEMLKEKGEVVLRETPGKKNIIRATVFEKDNHVHILSIQEYTPSTGNPHKLGFAFMDEEITKLFSFLRDVQTMRFGDKKYQRLNDDDIQYIALTNSQAAAFFQKNTELFTSIMQSQMTEKDIVAFAYRKKQLEHFYNLLLNPEYFQATANKEKTSPESTWQHFFEKNPWIFGYGLGYVFLEGLDGKKLEQVVQGYSLNAHGKRIDAVMKTRGIISNLCFVEIKTHKTALLEDKPYRTGCYGPSKELAGAIAQVQGSVTDAIKGLTNKLLVHDSDGNPTGEQIYNYQAKSFLVIGSMSEFITHNGVNEDKLRSFELLRKNTLSPEIITFDELYERARFIVEYNESTSK